MPGTAAVIVNYRTKELTAEAVASVLGEPGVQEVVVVDNASGDDSAGYLPAAIPDPRLVIVESTWNRGFGAAVNLAVERCHSPLLLILNSDARLAPGSLARLAAALLADEGVGVVGPAVHDVDGRPQPGAYGRLPRRRDLLSSRGWAHPRSDDSAGSISPGWISGVAMLLCRGDFVALGGFDEGFAMYLEDVDLCRRLRAAGKSVRREPSAVVFHHGGGSWTSGRDQRRRFHESKLRYFEKLGATRFELDCVRLAGRIRTAAPSPGRTSRSRRR